MVHAAITGAFECPLPELPAITYRGRFRGGAQIADADGQVLARREGADGSGYVIAEVQARRSEPREPVPNRFWLHRRGALSALAWNTQRVLGRRWYERHVRGRPALDLEQAPAGLSQG